MESSRFFTASLHLISLIYLSVLDPLASLQAQPSPTPTVALTNGQRFNGRRFESRLLYSVNGRFTRKKPARVDSTIDLTGLYMVPPFAEAHNHNINGGNARNQKAIGKYLNDGVFYVKLPGNFYIDSEEREKLKLNTASSIDVSLSQGATFTSTWGHPYALAENVWFKFGYAKGPIDSLNGRRFFTIDREEEIAQKWPQALKQGPDFIKTILWHSDEYQKRKGNREFYGQSGLNPAWLPEIVRKAHGRNLRVSTHVNNAYDFHAAVSAGVDEINHLPLTGLSPISAEDARLAAKQGIVVVTTCTAVYSLPPNVLPKANLVEVLKVQQVNLKLLRDNGVTLAIGSDMPNDSSVEEVEFLQKLGIFDNVTLLKMWTENTPKTIFPDRKISQLDEGYEASFLALESNPLEDFQNVHKIKLRFKQGHLVRP